MKIAIIGQGAIGLLWYHQLAKDTCNDVSLLYSPRIKSIPISTTLTDIDNLQTSRPLIIATSEKLQQAELVLICVKSYHIKSVLVSSVAQVSSTASIVFCHNGIVDFEQLKALKQPCYTLLTTHGSKIVKPFHAHHTGLGHNDLGLISGSVDAIEQNEVISTLAKALPSLTFSHNIKEKQWLKLIINCVINPITAIDNVENGQLTDNKYSAIIDKLLIEIVAIADDQGINFDINELKAQILSVATKTAMNSSSMRSDIQKKRQTEIDYINGYIVGLAKKMGLAVPENEKLLKQVKALVTYQ
jgi:2-dehydropantoate 2-reductase